MMVNILRTWEYCFGINRDRKRSRNRRKTTKTRKMALFTQVPASGTLVGASRTLPASRRPFRGCPRSSVRRASVWDAGRGVQDAASVPKPSFSTVFAVFQFLTSFRVVFLNRVKCFRIMTSFIYNILYEC
jgi:hypothetical protein